MNDSDVKALSDLTGLGHVERINVAIAQAVESAQWYESNGMHFLKSEFGWFATVRTDGRAVYRGPDYASDPAAWGALMEKELGGWERSPLAKDGTYAHFAWYWEEARDWNRTQGPWRRSVGEAVCCAVLQKHGVDPNPYLGD